MRLTHLSVLVLAATSCLSALGQTPSTSENQYLKGQYAFLVRGVTQTSASAHALQAALIGSFTADGNGNVSGVAAINSAATSMRNLPVSGSYTINSDGTGTLGLLTPLGTAHFALSVVAGATATIQSGVVTSLANPTGTGSFHLQDPAAFSSSTAIPQDGQFLVELSGETPCSGACPATGPGPMYASAQGNAIIHLNQPNAAASGTMTLPVVITAGTSYAVASLTGTLSVAGPRGGRLLTVTGASSSGLSQFAIYQYGLGSFYMMSVNPHSSAPLLSGNVQLAQ